MKENIFVRQNEAKWQRYESGLTTSPDQIADSFIELSSDLSYANTFFPDSGIIPYLNRLTGAFYQKIYRNKKEDKGRFILFFMVEIPLIMAARQKKLLYSFLFFSFFCFTGAFSAAHDQQLVNRILGDDYVNMTNANIRKGDPFHVYKQNSAPLMFITIAANNIYVSFNVFVSGIFLGAGTLYNLFTNGLILGSFEYYFFAHGLGIKSLLVIFIHGTLEISALVITGCAGLNLGASLLFPGSYSRLYSVKKAALEGIKIMIALVPVFIIAALLESSVTRHDQMPLALSLVILVSSLLFILGYFVFYPGYLTRINHQLTQYKPTP